MARALLWLVFLLLGGGCLTAVEERWCDTARPCSPGFVCTNFHCVPMGSVGGGSSTGGGGGVTGGGGGVTGGGGGVTGGGGGSVTGGGGGLTGGGGGLTGGGAGGGGSGCAASCDGCCLPSGACVPVRATTVVNCGVGGAACVACGIGQLCQGGLCVSPADAGISGPGGPCTSDAQCGGDRCLTEQDGWPGGYCLRFCDNTQCPVGADCVQAQTGGGEIINVCLTSCPTGSECRTQYQCAQGLCLPP